MNVLFDNNHLIIESAKDTIAISNAGSYECVLIYPEEIKDLQKALDKFIQKEYNKGTVKEEQSNG